MGNKNCTEKNKDEWHKIRLERFMKRIIKTLSCWIWQGSKAKGYGMFRIGYKNVRANRLAWIFFKGAIPTGLFVLHTCDNPSCVNPEHLFLGNAMDNCLDKMKKNRYKRGIIFGEKIGLSKLKEEDIKEIRKRYQNGNVSQRSLAKTFGVRFQTIGAVVRNETWTHI